MKGVTVPPHEDDFTADPVELFFDLAYVFAFSRLVHLLIEHPNWTGFGEFALLFLMIWMPWSQFTWSANAVAGNARPVRLMFLIATVACVPMAGSVESALSDSGNGGSVFAISLSVILAIALVMMIFGVDATSTVRSSIVRYSANNWIAIGLFVTGGFLDRTPRVVVWSLALASILIGTILAGGREWLVRPGHFAERHGLIVIVALGEVIVALGAPVVASFAEAGDLPAETLIALIAAGTFGCLLWWSFFDRPNPSLEHRHHRHDDAKMRGRYARDVYTYAHLPIVAGVILSAAALETITMHPSDELGAPFRWMLIAGLGLTLLGVSAAVYRAFGVIAHERIAAGAVLFVVVALGGSISGLMLLVLVDAVLLAMLIVEHVRIEQPSTATATRGVTPR